MTTSQTAFLSEILGDEKIPAAKLAYFRRRLSNHVYAAVVNEFLKLEKAGLINRAELAKRIGRRPEQVTRWLGSSGNWTIETVSDLLLAMKCEPLVSIAPLPTANTGRTADARKVIPLPAGGTQVKFSSIDRTFQSIDAHCG